ncbi:MAG TPA: DUF362 domain-containing protein [Firmicutes bacterium]|nr:DUF362 domain-containing protein [Bacillota bacterium]
MSNKAEVYLVATAERKEGVRRCFRHLGRLDYRGKKIFVKPNFNTADECPGSTHNDTLEQLLLELLAFSPAALTVGERSGPAVTAEVFRTKKVDELCDRLGVNLINFEELTADEWLTFDREDLHWPGGLQIPRAVADADAVVATCTLKTHGFGGVFSMSLKLGVGLVPKDFQKLHGSPHMRKMIAEINLAYRPDFVLMDGIDVFTDGGPMEGKRAKGNVMLVSRDRVALDAVGLALLKHLGSNRQIMETPIFQQEQIARAVELGLGVTSPAGIELVTDDADSAALAGQLAQVLAAEK